MCLPDGPARRPGEREQNVPDGNEGRGKRKETHTRSAPELEGQAGSAPVLLLLLLFFSTL